MDKQKIEMLVNKVKKAQKLMEEVKAEILHCSSILNWHIFEYGDFEKICKVLGIEPSGERSEISGKTHYHADYKGLEIICVE